MMDLFGPNGCEGLRSYQANALTAIANELIGYALAQPRHPAALHTLADELQHRAREAMRDIFGHNIDYDEDRPERLYAIAVGSYALNELTLGRHDIAIGRNSGRTMRLGSRCILLGDNTLTPTPDSDGFVNIDNRLCFWRDTGEIAECPAPFVEE